MANAAFKYAWPILTVLALATTSIAGPVAKTAKPAASKNIFESKKMATAVVIDEMRSCMKTLANASGTTGQKLKHCGCVTDWIRSTAKKPTADQMYEVSRRCGRWSAGVASEDGISRSPFYLPSIGFESERALSAHVGCIEGGKKTDPTATFEYSTAFCACIGDAVRFRKGTVEKPFANVTDGDQKACTAHARSISGRK